jgi:hypothetical protein
VFAIKGFGSNNLEIYIGAVEQIPFQKGLKNRVGAMHPQTAVTEFQIIKCF